MKLVELLARELEKWPEGVVRMCQSVVDSEFYGDNDLGDCIFRAYPKNSSRKPLSEAEYEYVTRAQWQAERDRQKGGEWKRHRGGKCPVSADTQVEVKHYDGEVMIRYAHQQDWAHDKPHSPGDIMKYRVIGQPQAEEVPMIADGDTREYKGPFPCAPEGEPLKQLEWDIQFPSGVCSVQAKTEQMETPFKWRDEVTELNAYIEKYTRERDALIERLASEGFALIPPVVSVVSEFYGVQQIIPFEEWTDGDIVRCIDTGLSCADLTLGNEYTVVTRHGETGVIDDEGDHMCSCIDVGELEFVRRP